MKRVIAALCAMLCLLVAGCTAAPATPAEQASAPSSDVITTTTTAPTTTTTTTTTTTQAAATTAAVKRVQHAGLYEAGNLAVQYEQAADERIYPASLVKITTAYTALCYVSADAEFTVGSELSLVKAGSSLCRIQRGYRMTLRDLIAGLMISSGNDAAYTIAVNVARMVSENETMSNTEAVAYFCDLMNKTARELGAHHSHYTNPDGWDDPNQYTTVQDLAILIQKAMRWPEICDVVASAQKTVSVGGGATLTFRSTNQFLHHNSQFYDERVFGFKTGSTPRAGKCLAVTMRHNGKTYIAIVTNCATDTERYRTMQNLIARLS